MAQGKKSIVVYSDWDEYFNDLSDEEAGKLIKHFFAYVNDENPILNDRVLEMAFKPIKNQLKRDLEKWEETKKKRSESGKAGGLRSGEVRKQNEANEANASITKQNEANEAVNDNVIMCNNMLDVNDSVNVNENDILFKKESKKSLLSEICISDLEFNEVQYFEIALAYQKLFIKNLKEKNAPFASQEKATYKNYVTPIRLMMTADGVTKEQLTKVYKYLGSIEGEFWKPNILSTSKLREKFQQLLLKSQENGKSGNNQGGNTTPTTNELAEQSYNAVARLLGRTE